MTYPTPFFNYCPKCGSMHFTANGERSMICKSCKFEFYLNVASAVTAIIMDNNGRILLTRRSFNPQKGKLDLPGGFVEFNESAHDAIVRELKEELGADMQHITFFDTFSNEYSYSGLTIHTLDVTFLVKLQSLQLTAMDDVASFEFYDLDDIPMQEIAFQSTRNTILKLKKLHHE
ncbi:MAG: NUDIX domain-containing protein [Mangrovibacterium sp.]